MPAHPKIIPEPELRKLYLDQKLSTDSVGNIFGCNHVTVLNYLKKYNIPRRAKLGLRKPIEISKEDLSKLYIDQKLTQKQIANKLGHSVYGIERRMKIYEIKGRTYHESHKVREKFNFSDNLAEKAYLIGFRLGDLNVYRVKKLIQVRCSTTIQNQVDLIEGLFKNYGYVHIWKAKRGTFEIVVLLNESFNFLIPKQDAIEEWILRDKKLFLSFLAGYSDAEGSYYLKKSRYKNGSIPGANFEIQTYDKNILKTISSEIFCLGVENKFYLSRKAGYSDKRGVKNNKNAWRFAITKKQFLWDFIKIIEKFHKHKGKLDDIDKIRSNLISRNGTFRHQKIIL